MKLNLFIYSFFLCVAILSLVPQKAFSQKAMETFGKSRIQYRYFEWKYYSTPHFDIYYYYGGQKLAKHVAENIEEEYLRITDIMGYAPFIKTKVFIFNSNLDLNQSNVGLKEATFDISGQTNFLKTHVELAFEGSYNEFQKELSYKVSNLFVKDMLFGGGLVSEVFQSNYLFTVPDWFINGISAYIAYGWSAEMDDFVREFLVKNSANNIKKLEGKEAELAGQSVWNYISEKYGRINISNILNLTRIIRNEEKSITNTLGIRYRAFLSEYRYFYVNSLANLETEQADRKNQLSKPWKKDLVYKSKLSPNGEWLAYSINDKGKYKVKLREISSGDEKTIFKGGQKRLDGDAYLSAPAMDWGDSATFGLINYERGVTLLKLYNPYEKKWQTRDLRRFDQVHDLDIYPNGKTAVLSATVNAQSDLYLISTGRPNIRRLTNDVFDDLNPAFIPDTKRIIFSSNRTSDSLSIDLGYDKASKNYNLFEIDIDEPDQVNVITKDFGSNTDIVIPDSTAIYYLSDKSGIYNIYRLNLDNKTSTQITAFNTSIEQYDLNTEFNNLSFTLTQRGDEKFYFDKSFDEKQTKFMPSTLRKQVELSRNITITSDDEKKKKKSNQFTEPKVISSFSDSLNISNELNSNEFENSGKLNADDFQFEQQNFNNQNSESSLLKNLSKLRSKSNMMGPYDYEPTFTTDNVTASWVVDPLIGFSIFSLYQMNDLRENNKFYGGFNVSLQNFKSGQIFGEYQYLERLVDYSVRFDRKVYFHQLDNRFAEQTYGLNSLTFGASYPLSNNSRISVKPHISLREFTETSTLILTNQNANLAKDPIVNEFLFGGKIEYVFDNSEPLGLNIRQGLRAKAVFENYSSGFAEGQSFSKLFIDIRNYQKVFRELTFASRLYAGGFFGQNSPYFMLGGVDNWIFPRVNSPGPGEVSPDQNPLALTSTENPEFNTNILFHEFVTGLRGFRWNEFSGKNVILLSNELRFPIFRVLSNNAISSNFARNFQLIGFYDIGTAWLGGSPWDRDNSINKQNIESNNFRAEIRNYKNPWLSSVGVGVRTTILGYYIRLDYAYPIEDYLIQNTRLSLSIGYDF